MIKTFPGTGINYTPNTGNWASCVNGLGKVFNFISISNNFGSQADWDCANSVYTAGVVDTDFTTGTNNGTIIWNVSTGNELTNPTFTSDTQFCNAEIQLQWQGSEAGVCGGGPNGVASAGGAGSWDLWRAVFNMTDDGNHAPFQMETHLLRIETAIPNAPVISVPFSVVF